MLLIQRFSSNITFQNLGHPAETVQINFKEDSSSIISDWNFLVVRTIGKTTNLHKKEERFKHFFEIYERIKSIESYNGLESIQLNTWDLLPQKFGDITQFRNTLSKSSTFFNELEINDAALTFEGINKSSGTEFSFTFGPFNRSKDIIRHNLSLFDTDVFASMSKVPQGCLVACNISSKKESFDSDTLKTLLQQKEKIIKSIKDEQ